MAISLSGTTLSPPTLPGWLATVLQQAHIEPWQLILIFDATELAALAPARSTLEALRTMGCHLALDGVDGVHAGEGLSGEAQADILLMTPSLSRRAQPESLERHIVAALCQVAHLRRQRVVARAVEGDAQRQHLRQLGIDALQGRDAGQAIPLAELLSSEGEKKE